MIENTEYRALNLRYRLVERELVIDCSATEDRRRLPLAMVKHVRIYVAQGRSVCILTPTSGRTLTITTPPKASPDVLRAYSTFVRTLHARLALEAPNATLVAGHGAFFALHIVCCAAIAIYATLFVVALVAGIGIEKLGPTLPSITLPMIALASSSKGRPRSYSRGVVPAGFLPA